MPYKHCPMSREPRAITFIPWEVHFRPVLPTVAGNVDYLTLREQPTTIDELSETSTLQRYATWLPGEETREVINGLLRKAGAAMVDGKQALDLEETLDLSALVLNTTYVKANIDFPTGCFCAMGLRA